MVDIYVESLLIFKLFPSQINVLKIFKVRIYYDYFLLVATPLYECVSIRHLQSLKDEIEKYSNFVFLTYTQPQAETRILMLRIRVSK